MLFHGLAGAFLDLEDLQSILQCIHPGSCVGGLVVKKLMVMSFALHLHKTAHCTRMYSISSTPFCIGVQMGRAPTTKWLSLPSLVCLKDTIQQFPGCQV